MKIVQLTSENVKRLTAVNISPQGNVVVIGGENGQGKSSVLDSILFALGGDPDVKMPVRRGEEKAKIMVNLGDLIVRRTFTAGGGTSLIVSNADGVKMTSPQAILDKLIGKLTFDPLDFARQKPSVQAETLRVLVGLDFSDLDSKYQSAYSKRTAVNREAKALESQFASIPVFEGLPPSEVSTQSILDEQREASEVNRSNSQLRTKTETQRGIVHDLQCELDSAMALLEATKQKISKLQSESQLAVAILDDLESRSKSIKDIDLSGFKTKLASVEESNQKVRQAKRRADLVAQFKAKSAESDALTSELESLESTKRRATTEAKYPVEGLLFDTAGGVLLNGIPFEQCSSAEQLKVSVAIGFALNPKLKVVLIRDGSLLDDNSMQMLFKMAEAADAQVWIERVGKDATTSVVIEDGHISES